MKSFSMSVTWARLSSLLLPLRLVGLLDDPFSKSPGDQGLTGLFCCGCCCRWDCRCEELDSPSGSGREGEVPFPKALRGAEVLIGLAMAAIDAEGRKRGHCWRMERREEEERRFMDRQIWRASMSASIRMVYSRYMHEMSIRRESKRRGGWLRVLPLEVGSRASTVSKFEKYFGDENNHVISNVQQETNLR